MTYFSPCIALKSSTIFLFYFFEIVLNFSNSTRRFEMRSFCIPNFSILLRIGNLFTACLKRIVPKESRLARGLVPEHLALSAFRNFTYSLIPESILIYISRQFPRPPISRRRVCYRARFLFIFRIRAASRASINKRYKTQKDNVNGVRENVIGKGGEAVRAAKNRASSALTHRQYREIFDARRTSHPGYLGMLGGSGGCVAA